MQITTGAVCDAKARPGESAVESVLYAVMTIGRLLRQRLQGDVADPGTFWLLKSLAANGAMRVTELAAIASLDASTVSRHVQQMHRTGLIERAPDPDDGRAQRVTISAQGLDILREGLVRRRELLGRGLAGWDPSDLETFDRLLARFVGNIENNTELEHV